MKRKLYSAALVLCLLASTFSLSGCDGNTAKFIRTKALDLQAYTDQGFAVVDQFETEGLLTEEYAKVARETLTEIKNGTEVCLAEIEKYKVTDLETGEVTYKFNSQSKRDLGKLFVSVLHGAQEFESKASPQMIEAVIKALQEKGILKPGDPEAVASKVKLVTKGLVTVARVIQNHLE